VVSEWDQVVSFKVRDPFMAEFHCERENHQAGCLPITPMTLRFSARIAREQVRQVTLVGLHNERWNPQVERTERAEPMVTSVVFHGPFPEAAPFQLEIPDSLTDEAGRVLANADKFPRLVKTGESPPVEGNLVLQASVVDESGHIAAAHQEVWVRGAQDW
jgi:alpha-2-macroglobulin